MPMTVDEEAAVVLQSDNGGDFAPFSFEQKYPRRRHKNLRPLDSGADCIIYPTTGLKESIFVGCSYSGQWPKCYHLSHLAPRAV